MKRLSKDHKTPRRMSLLLPIPVFKKVEDLAWKQRKNLSQVVREMVEDSLKIKKIPARRKYFKKKL